MAKTKTETSKSDTAAAVFNDLGGQIMILCAFRYCLGRQTYVVSACIDYMRRWWSHISVHSRQVIVRDIVEAIMDGDLSTIDLSEWKAFAEFAFSQLPSENQAWCRYSVLWKDKPWPLFEKREMNTETTTTITEKDPNNET